MRNRNSILTIYVFLSVHLQLVGVALYVARVLGARHQSSRRSERTQARFTALAFRSSTLFRRVWPTVLTVSITVVIIRLVKKVVVTEVWI